MTAWPGRNVQLLWGPGNENVLAFDWPAVADMPRFWRAPRAGSEQVFGAGVQDAWVTGRDYCMELQARWLFDSAWAGPGAVQAFIDWCTAGNSFALVPDAVNAPLFAVPGCLLTDPFDKIDPALEQTGAQNLKIVFRNPTYDLGLAWRGLMFEYVPGADLSSPAAATQSRASTAFQQLADKSWNQAATNALRDRNREAFTGGAILTGGDITRYAIMNPVVSWPTTAVSIEAWARLDDSGANDRTFFSYNVSGNDNQIILEKRATTLGVAFFIKNTEVDSTNPFPTDGLWHHYAATWASAGGVWAIYVDGALWGSGTGLATGQTIDGGGSFVMGQEQDTVGDGFDVAQAWVGAIDEGRVYARVLSPAEVQAHVKGQYADETGLRLWWGFDRFEQMGADYSGTGNNGVVTATPTPGVSAGSTRTALVEIGVGNLLAAPEDFSSASWVKRSITSVTTNMTDDPVAPNHADKILATAGTAIHDARQDAIFAAGRCTMSALIAGSASGDAGNYPYCRVQIWNATDGFVAMVALNLSTGAVISSSGLGGLGIRITEVRDNVQVGTNVRRWWWVSVSGIATVASAGYIQLSDSAGNESTALAGTEFLVVAAARAYAGSFGLGFGGTGGTQSSDAFSYPFPWNYQPMFMYVKTVETGMRFGNGSAAQTTVIIQLGTSADRITIEALFPNYSAIHFTATNSGTARPVGQQHDVVELLLLMNADGSLQLISSLNGTADGVASASSPVPSGPAWNGAATVLLKYPDSNSSVVPIAAVKIGPQSFMGQTRNTMALARAA